MLGAISATFQDPNDRGVPISMIFQDGSRVLYTGTFRARVPPPNVDVVDVDEIFLILFLSRFLNLIQFNLI